MTSSVAGTVEFVQRTAATDLIAVLTARGIDRVFCVPGESYLAVLDALYSDRRIDLVTCRHEGSAAFAALADAKLTEHAGVCLVSRAPGATNASIAVHSAAEDATPLVLIVGQVTVAELGQQSFQEIDCQAVFGSVAKGVWTVLDPAQAGATLGRAIRVAESGTPGPVVVAIPEDVFNRSSTAALPGPEPHPTSAGAGVGLIEARRLLRHSRRPLLLAGGGLSSAQGRRVIRQVAERLRIPVVTSNKHQDLLDNHHPCYAGHLHNNTPATQRGEFSRSDLLLAVGTRLDTTTTGGGIFPASPEPAQQLIHVYPDPAVLGVRYRTTLAIAGDPAGFLAELADQAIAPDPERDAWIAGLHSIEAEKALWHDHPSDDGIPFGLVVTELDRLTGGNLTVTVDSGTFTSWLYRYLRLGAAGRLLGVTSSAMGFGVPAGLAAALRGGRPVVAVVGDGGFLMTGSELATAVERRLPLVIVIADNSSYATIRAHQERHYPGRVIGTDLTNPDFALLAEAYNCLGVTVERDSDIEPALRRCLAADGPAVLAVRTSLNWISAYRRLALAERLVPA